MTQTQVLLKAEQLSKHYGGVKAVDDLNITIEVGKIIGLIGPNGAGKSTVFNLLSGAIRPTNGAIFIKKKNVTGKKADVFSKQGVARTFQNIRLFKSMTVFENILIGFHKSANPNLFTSILRTGFYQKRENELRDKVNELLTSFDLYDQKDELAINLSYGEQRKVEILRALASSPEILFLDEPAAGMNPVESKQLVALIKDIWKRFQLTVVLVEHDMSVVMELCQEILVLDQGKLIFQGNPEEVRNSKTVQSAYLGGVS